MDCDFKGEWAEIKERMEVWWARGNSDRPVMALIVPRVKDAGVVGWSQSSSGEDRDETKKRMAQQLDESDYEKYWTDYNTLMARQFKLFEQHHFTAEAYPRFYANLTVTGLGVFLGATPIFRKDTAWCGAVLEGDPDGIKLQLDKNNKWLRWSLDLTQRAVSEANGLYVTGCTELAEHADVLAAMFGVEQLLCHMVDCPKEIHRLLNEVQDAWYEAYDFHYNILKEPDGYSHFGPFQLMGKGRVAKLQCDMSAMISAEMFEEFVMPHLKKQADWLDRSMYHLDGTAAVRHLDKILSIDSLDALQWTPGAGEADGGNECWDFIYEKALNAGKSIYALVGPQNLQRFIKRFGSRGVYIVSGAANPEMGGNMVKMAEQLCKDRTEV